MSFIGECKIGTGGLSAFCAHAPFLFWTSHRTYIVRVLPDLLEDLDPCEAVEYVIPLLTGFALDEGRPTL